MSRSIPEWIGKTDDTKIPNAVRQRVEDRQGGKCACCGTEFNHEVDQIDCDHIVPLKDGGEHRESNLQALLRAHHITKTNAENVARAAANRRRARAYEAQKRETNSDRLIGGRKMPGRSVKYSAAQGRLVDRVTREPVEEGTS